MLIKRVIAVLGVPAFWLVGVPSAAAQGYCSYLCSGSPTECGIECTDDSTFRWTTCSQAGYDCCNIQYVETERVTIGSNLGGVPGFYTLWETDIVSYIEVGCGYG